MNLQDQVIYRCIHAACARQMPRRVNFCPWCGTGQHDGVVNPAHVARPAQPEYQAAVAPPAPPPPAPVAPPQYTPTPEPVQSAYIPPPPPPLPPAPVGVPMAPPPPAPPPPAAATNRGPFPANPPRRAPVRLRYWLIALATLWLIWLYAKPDNKIEERIENAITASKECRFNDAQSELIALRMTKATPEQLQSLQSAISDAGSACNKKKAREKAWNDTRDAVENLLGSGEFAKAQARLNKFTDRYREDDETRKLKARIGQQRADAAPVALPVPVGEELPPPRPARSASATAQSVRNLIDEADRALRAGDYVTASEKLEICITMVDEGNRECAAFKVHADRMQRDKERCLGAGRAWLEDRCR